MTVFFSSFLPNQLGLAIDTLFERADMMDVECAERFCDWFSHHLSNFDFKWHWQKWYARSLHRAMCCCSVALGQQANAAVFVCRTCRACLRAYVLKMNEEEPKRLVVREILERTMWLAYYERVARTLPEEFIELMPCRPAPFLKYADVAAEVHLPDWPPHTAYRIPHSSRPLTNAHGSCRVVLQDHEAYASLLAKVRAKEKSEQLRPWLDSLTSISTERRLDLALHALLEAGCKSFSHLLNVLERFACQLLPHTRHRTRDQVAVGLNNHHPTINQWGSGTLLTCRVAVGSLARKQVSRPPA